MVFSRTIINTRNIVENFDIVKRIQVMGVTVSLIVLFVTSLIKLHSGAEVFFQENYSIK